MRTILSAFFILALSFVSFVCASDDGDVVVLTKSTYKDFVSKEDLSLVEFYAPWCGHCKALAPEYVKAAGELKPLNIPIAKVDCTTEEEVCSQNDVRGYPTLKVFRKGTPQEYKGARTAASIVSYMKKQSLPAVSVLTADKIQDFTTTEPVVVIGFFKSKTDAAYKTFRAVADKLRDDFIFGATFDAAAAKTHGGAEAGVPAIVLFKDFDEGKNVYGGDISSESAITDFIKTKSLPLIGEIGPENYASYVESGLPMAYYFYDSADTRKSAKAILEDAAKEHKGKMNFVFIDAVKYGGHARTMNLKETWPAFGVHDPVKNTKFPFDQSKDITKEAVEEFVAQVVAGDVKPSLRSEPVPEKNDGPVKTVVGNNYDAIVNNVENDVFLELYATWCGHCKKLAPIWEKLGEKYADIKGITIAQMEATENDLPPSASYQVSGFPTLKLIKAKTNEVVDYNGDRSLEDMIEFLEKNAVHGGQLNESAAAGGDDEAAGDDAGEDAEESAEAEEGADEDSHDEL